MRNNEITEMKKTFDDYKKVDENGKEYWSARDLSKAMGYSRYNKFIPAVDRAKQSIESMGKDPDDHMYRSVHMVELGSGAQREVVDIQLDKYSAYLTAMNADPSKEEVAFAQEYFLQSTAKAEIIEKRLNDKEYIDIRNNLRIQNKKLNAEILSRDVEPEEVGSVLSAGDQGMFNMSTKELKEEKNIPDNRPIADFMGSEVAAYKTVANINARQEIEKYNLYGVDPIKDAVYTENQKMREMFIDKFEDTPENKFSGEDVKKVERKYNRQTKKFLDALNYES